MSSDERDPPNVLQVYNGEKSTFSQVRGLTGDPIAGVHSKVRRGRPSLVRSLLTIGHLARGEARAAVVTQHALLAQRRQRTGFGTRMEHPASGLIR